MTHLSISNFGMLMVIYLTSGGDGLPKSEARCIVRGARSLSVVAACCILASSIPP